ncbi:branched-chain amino acid ABC transporter [Consotaella aegiceratis]|uniref:branched-chain amino acid ABC transporter n=1 Tax=Consotaella aegiceratis TaxID=3097961 RepID=UPI002F3EC5ED
MTTKEQAASPAFDLADLDASDEDEMEVYSNGNQTGWKWRFAGPGHPKAIEQSNRLARERLQRERQQEQAQVNGRKWKAPEESPDEALERNVRVVTDRLLGWSPITMGGEPYPYSPENARALLMDRRKSALLIQALEFLGDERSFTTRSEKA